MNFNGKVNIVQKNKNTFEVQTTLGYRVQGQSPLLIKFVHFISFITYVLFSSYLILTVDEKAVMTGGVWFLLQPQASVVQTLDSAIHRINHYPADKYWGNQLHYPLDSVLSGG